MKNSGRLILTGTGGSMGVPLVGCSCHVCHSTDTKNQRLRSGVYIELGEAKILIDASPDLRMQCLRHHIHSVDYLLFTHAHQDHVGGIDDLRAFFYRREHPLVCYASKETWDDLKRRFSYIFQPSKENETLLPKLQCITLEKERGIFYLGSYGVKFFTFQQSSMKVLGFRFGSLAYVSDIKKYPETIFEDLQGVDTLIVSALRFTPSVLHFDIDEAIDFAKKVGAKKTWITHIAHDLDYEKTNAYLPPSIRLSYDGLQIEFETEISCKIQ